MSQLKDAKVAELRAEKQPADAPESAAAEEKRE